MARLNPTTEEQRAIQREFFQLDERTMDRIRRLKPRLMKYAESALETIFDHLVGNPEVAHYFEIDENVAYLRAGMLSHCDKLFSARYDDAYYEAAEDIGERHSKLEFLSHVHSAGYSNMLTRVIELAMADRNRFTVEDIVALTRATMYDMELTTGSFFTHHTEKRHALDGDAMKIRHLIETT